MPLYLSVNGVQSSDSPKYGEFDLVKEFKIGERKSGQKRQSNVAQQGYRKAFKNRSPKHISSIMTREVISLSTEDRLSDAIQLIHEKNIRHLPVAELGRLKGMISDRDLIGVSPQDSRLVRGIMNTKLWVASPETTLQEAARILLDRRVHCLPVVSEKTNELIGIVTSSDLLGAIAESESLDLFS